MTYEDVVEFFGKEDRSAVEILIKLSFSKPDFGENDLLDVFSLVRAFYRSKHDLWRIMFETSEWDNDILFRPDFFKRFSAFVDSNRPVKKHHLFVSIPSKDIPRQNSLDFWEAVAEIRDKLAEKIYNASGL